VILFCADPLNPRRVDEHFAAEAETAGTARALIDHDALLAGDVTAAVRRVPAGSGPCWYRGWMIPSQRYGRLSAALASRGASVCTTPDRYRRAHELPGWIGTFRDVTPRTIWAVDPADAIARAGETFDGPMIVKDFVKSRKHEWAEACFVPGPDDLDRVVGRFVELQGDFLAGGIVVREFEQFVSDGPDAGEARVWWLDGVPIAVGPIRTRPSPVVIRGRISPRSHRCSSTRCWPGDRSDPAEDAFAPGVQQAEREHADEDGHLHDRRAAEFRLGVDDRPREQEDALDGEQHVQECVEVVADLDLGPAGSDRVDAALVAVEFARRVGRFRRAQYPVRTERAHEDERRCDQEDAECGVRAEVAVHPLRLRP
jgi:ATP-grasp domain, R2K clade family 3